MVVNKKCATVPFSLIVALQKKKKGYLISVYLHACAVCEAVRCARNKCPH